MQKETKEKKEVKEVKKSKVTEAKVMIKGSAVRTYTEEHSSKDASFTKKAEGYAKKIGGKVELV